MFRVHGAWGKSIELVLGSAQASAGGARVAGRGAAPTPPVAGGGARLAREDESVRGTMVHTLV